MITFTKNELKHVEVYSIQSYVIKIISRTDRHDVLLKMALNKQYAIIFDFIFQGIVLVYDVTDRKSFTHLSFWVDSVNKVGSQSPYFKYL
jgi:hypothetical protein